MAEDDVIDSWEDADMLDIEKQIEARDESLRSRERIKEIYQPTITADNKITILRPENPGRTEYVPQIKILKRPNGVGKSDANSKNQRQPMRSLAEREADYAAARARILGTEVSEDSDTDNETRKNILNDKILDRSIPAGIIRQPKGPDNTCGFKKSS